MVDAHTHLPVLVLHRRSTRGATASPLFQGRNTLIKQSVIIYSNEVAKCILAQ